MHPRLEQQVHDHLETAGIDQLALRPFLEAVQRAYLEDDAALRRAEAALERVSGELTARNADLITQLNEQQRAEAQLEHLLMLLGTTLESTADGILVLDHEGRALRFNRSFVEMWRVPDDLLAFWSHDGLMGHVRAQLADADAFMASLAHLCRHPEVECHDSFACSDGRVFERHSLPQFQGVDNVGRVLSFRDITARRQAETALLREKEEQRLLIGKLEAAHNQLLQSEKMASIGQLAAGVAHEINNPIGFIHSNLGTLRGYVDDLLEMLAAYQAAEAELPAASPRLARIAELKRAVDLDFLKEDIRALLAESGEGTERVRRIVNDLKDFSHADQGEWEWVDLHKGLDTTLNVVHNELKYKAEVIRDYGELPPVRCLPSQLNQVFMNLLVNAAQAIETRGTIHVRTGAAGGEAWVEIADSGQGIAAEHLHRIFDPFFTTKPVGKGTGLGLSISYGIVNKHGGRIEVASEPGQGTSFRVVLPVEPTRMEAEHA